MGSMISAVPQAEVVNNTPELVGVTLAIPTIDIATVIVAEPATHKVTALENFEANAGGIRYELFKGKSYNVPTYVSVVFQNSGKVIRN